jgi:hypothetical protein
MKVGIIQSSYLPWRGYFDLIDSVDLFVFHDDVQYTKNDWRNRNQVLAENQLKWITVPIKKHGTKEIIKNIKICENSDWRKKHLRIIEQYYGKAPHFTDVIELISKVYKTNNSNLSSLNKDLVLQFAGYLGIKTEFIDSSSLIPIGSKTDRVIDILRKCNATSYLSGPSADTYLDKKLFEKFNIELCYKSYVYDDYPQLGSGPFQNASIVDLISNMGKESIKLMKSTVPDLLIVKSIPSTYKYKKCL